MQKNPNPEKQYVVSHSVLQSVLDYLSRKPYAEVFTLVQAVQSVQALEESGAKNEQSEQQ